MLSHHKAFLHYTIPTLDINTSKCYVRIRHSFSTILPQEVLLILNAQSFLGIPSPRQSPWREQLNLHTKTRSMNIAKHIASMNKQIHFYKVSNKCWINRSIAKAVVPEGINLGPLVLKGKLALMRRSRQVIGGFLKLVC